jgi:hypothetical protein
MNHLVPCPECSRHVRVSETECPFCALPLDLAQAPEPQLPRTRLGRAATFAFGATLVSATALVACGADADDSSAGGGAAGAATSGSGGAAAGGAAAGTGGSTAIAGTSSIGGSAMAVYGAPAGGSFGSGTGGTGAGGGPIPVYGAAP